MSVMTVKELADAANLTAEAVRYYTRIGLLCPERDPYNGYRKFSHADIHRLRFIHRAKSLGFTLAEITLVFADVESGQSPCPRVRDILQQRIEQNHQKIEALLDLQARMEVAASQWRAIPDGDPDGDSICCLIEAIDA